jgi:hypothetical protein
MSKSQIQKSHPVFAASQSLFQAEDGKGCHIFISSIKNYILIVVRAQSLTQAKEIFASFQEAISNYARDIRNRACSYKGSK